MNDDILNSYFYFCDLISGQDDCPKKEECKRWATIKDIPYSDYDKYRFARLKNVCNRTHYLLFMKLDKEKEVTKNDEELHDKN